MISRPSTNKSKKAAPKRATDRNAEAKRHLPRMKKIHPELCEMVNKFLQERNVPLKVNAMHFTTNMAAADFKCCTINGMVVCGPQCW